MSEGDQIWVIETGDDYDSVTSLVLVEERFLDELGEYVEDAYSASRMAQFEADGLIDGYVMSVAAFLVHEAMSFDPTLFGDELLDQTLTEAKASGYVGTVERLEREIERRKRAAEPKETMVAIIGGEKIKINAVPHVGPFDFFLNTQRWTV